MDPATIAVVAKLLAELAERMPWDKLAAIVDRVKRGQPKTEAEIQAIIREVDAERDAVMARFEEAADGR